MVRYSLISELPVTCAGLKLGVLLMMIKLTIILVTGLFCRLTQGQRNVALVSGLEEFIYLLC